MKPPWPLAHRVLTATAIIALIAAVWCLWSAKRWWDRVERAENEPALQMRVDLSTPGEFSGTLHQFFNNAHSESLVLRLTPPPSANEDFQGLLRGLDACIEILRPDGSVVSSSGLSLDVFELQGSEGSTRRISDNQINPTLPIGEYRFVLRVVLPVPRLAGRSQEILVEYNVCGAEFLPAVVMTVFSVPLFLTSGVLGAILCWRRHRAKGLVRPADAGLPERATLNP